MVQPIIGAGSGLTSEANGSLSLGGQVTKNSQVQLGPYFLALGSALQIAEGEIAISGVPPIGNTTTALYVGSDGIVKQGHIQGGSGVVTSVGNGLSLSNGEITLGGPLTTDVTWTGDWNVTMKWLVVTDQIQYQTDTLSGWNAHTLYVDEHGVVVPGLSVTADSGVHQMGGGSGNIRLGGDLMENTTIGTTVYNFEISKAFQLNNMDQTPSILSFTADTIKLPNVQYAAGGTNRALFIDGNGDLAYTDAVAQSFIVEKPGTTVSSTDTGIIFCNGDIPPISTYTLPNSGTPGNWLYFKDEVGNILVDSPGGVTIIWGQQSGNRLNSTDHGVIKLWCKSASEWHVLETLGTWTLGNQ